MLHLRGKVCCNIFWLVLTQSLASLKGDDGERPEIAADCDHASRSLAMLSLNQANVFMISYPSCVDTHDCCHSGKVKS